MQNNVVAVIFVRQYPYSMNFIQKQQSGDVLVVIYCVKLNYQMHFLDTKKGAASNSIVFL